MALDKNQLRKLHGLPPATDGGDPSVLARRRFHEAAAKWCVRWLAATYAISGLFGILVILLPVLVKPWRLIIESTPILSQIFHSYSSLSGLSMTHLWLIIVLYFANEFFRKDLPGGQLNILTSKQVIDMELYPATRREEVAYWTMTIYAFAGSGILLFLPSGVLAYFILIRL